MLNSEDIFYPSLQTLLVYEVASVIPSFKISW